MRRLIAGTTCLCLVLATSCSHMVKMPSQSYEDVYMSKGTRYRIETADGHTYKTNHLTCTDTAFVIHTLYQKIRSTHRKDYVAVESFEVPFDHVVSMSKGETSPGLTAGLIMLTAAIAYVVVGLWAISEKWGSDFDH